MNIGAEIEDLLDCAIRYFDLAWKLTVIWYIKFDFCYICRTSRRVKLHSVSLAPRWAHSQTSHISLFATMSVTFIFPVAEYSKLRTTLVQILRIQVDRASAVVGRPQRVPSAVIGVAVKVGVDGCADDLRARVVAEGVGVAGNDAAEGVVGIGQRGDRRAVDGVADGRDESAETVASDHT